MVEGRKKKTRAKHLQKFISVLKLSRVVFQGSILFPLSRKPSFLETPLRIE